MVSGIRRMSLDHRITNTNHLRVVAQRVAAYVIRTVNIAGTNISENTSNTINCLTLYLRLVPSQRLELVANSGDEVFKPPEGPCHRGYYSRDILTRSPKQGSAWLLPLAVTHLFSVRAEGSLTLQIYKERLSKLYHEFSF